MQFVPNFPTMETPRPSMFGQFLPTIPQQGQPQQQEPPAGWLQVPPAHMPWGVPVANQPSVVRFTAEPPLLEPRPTLSGSMPFGQCKRKIEPDMELPRPKLLITEEKMAAHMSQLHISTDYTSHQSESDCTGTSTTTSREELPYRRLVLCDEIRQLKTEPILPTSLLAKMEKPTMALVLWEPPAGNLGEKLREATTSHTKTEAEQEEERRRQPVSASPGPGFPILDNNNTTAAVDLNSMTLPAFGPGSNTLAMDL